MFHRVVWDPAPHQVIYSPDHPDGCGCGVCTRRFPRRVVARRLTARGAARKADRLNAWSLTPGWFHAE